MYRFFTFSQTIPCNERLFVFLIIELMLPTHQDGLYIEVSVLWTCGRKGHSLINNYSCNVYSAYSLLICDIMQFGVVFKGSSPFFQLFCTRKGCLLFFLFQNCKKMYPFITINLGFYLLTSCFQNVYTIYNDNNNDNWHLYCTIYLRIQNASAYYHYPVRKSSRSFYFTQDQGWHSCASARHRPFTVFSGRTSFNLSLPLRVHLDAYIFTME